MHSKESRDNLGAPANVVSRPDPEFYTPPARRGGPPDVTESLASRLTALAQFAALFARHLQSLDNRLVVLEGLEKARSIIAGGQAEKGQGRRPLAIVVDLGQPAGDYAALAHADDSTDLLTSGFVYLNPQGADLLGKPLITGSEAFACDPSTS